jgi:hypothetical protein
MRREGVVQMLPAEKEGIPTLSQLTGKERDTRSAFSGEAAAHNYFLWSVAFCYIK